MCSADIFLGFLAVLFPPLPVWVKCGICSADSIINILLSILGYIPGLLHAWYVIAKYPEPPYEYESLPQHQEGGRVTYVFVQGPSDQQQQHGHQQQHNRQQTKPGAQHGGMNYGTQGPAGGSSASQNHSAPQPQQQGVSSNGEGSADNNNHGVPPSYADVVAGDHKVQSKD